MQHLQDDDEKSSDGTTSAWRKVKIISKIPFFHHSARKKRKTQDRMKSAIVRWQNTLLTKCFNTWKVYKRDRSDETESGELLSLPAKPSMVETKSALMEGMDFGP